MFDDINIDILHIDGRHEYECVKEDYELYKDKVDLDKGIIVFHDVLRKKNNFGVYKLFNSIQDKKFWMYQHSGLGIVTNNESFIRYLKDIAKYIRNPMYKNRNINGKEINILNEGNVPIDLLY